MIVTINNCIAAGLDPVNMGHTLFGSNPSRSPNPYSAEYLTAGAVGLNSENPTVLHLDLFMIFHMQTYLLTMMVHKIQQLVLQDMSYPLRIQSLNYLLVILIISVMLKVISYSSFVTKLLEMLIPEIYYNYYWFLKQRPRNCKRC